MKTQLNVASANQYWVDITYIPTAEGGLYLATVIDLELIHVDDSAKSSTCEACEAIIYKAFFDFDNAKLEAFLREPLNNFDEKSGWAMFRSANDNYEYVEQFKKSA